MPDYNKGDFTQQGIAGDVTSLVRLNEKRTVKLTLSADDASDNCDISGSVIDELNGKTYPIGAGVSGNIEITENGENINVAPYETATVNVSNGADIAFCDIKVVNNCGTTNGLGGGQVQAGYVVNDNVLDIPYIEIEDNTYDNIRVYYSISNGTPAILLSGLVESDPAYILTASENVGCTYMNNPSNTNFIAILLDNNETESSITIVITAPVA